MFSVLDQQYYLALHLYHYFSLDINECLENDPIPCDLNADCTDLDGSYVCECKDGFSGNGDEECIGNDNTLIKLTMFKFQL